MFRKSHEQALKDLHGLYLSHLDAIETASKSDLEAHTRERHHLFEVIRRGPQIQAGSLVNRNISELIEINRALAEKAESIKKALGQELNKLARGKQALTGYGQTGYNAGAAPRVLSLKK